MITENFNILNELKEAGAENLVAVGNGNCFSVPENYFNTLPETVMAHVFLRSVPSVNPFTVPSGYFEAFPSIVLEKITQADAVLAIPKAGTYTVPENYFNNLADNILNRIKNQPEPSEVQRELESISTLLSGIPKTNVYSVPDNYFETLSTPVNKQAAPAKVISISRSRKWINYAAAACIAVLMLGGGYIYLGKTRPASVAAVPAINVEAQISVLSDEEITNYLRANSNMSVYTNTSLEENQARNMDVQNMLQGVSDEEIQQYLEQDPESAHAEEGI